MRVMSTTEKADLVVSSPPGSAPEPARLWIRFRDLIICLGFTLFALWLTLGLWSDPDTRTLAHNPADQVLVEWFLSYGSRFWVGDFDLVTDRLNAPDGINMLTNAATVGLGVAFAPITWLWGAPTTFAFLMGFNLAATAAGWYLLFARTLGASRLAAAVGGAFCGFAPGMLAQANSHLHMTAQWLVPPMIWCVITMWRAAAAVDAQRRIIASSVLFGLLVTAQVFVGEETLFLTAVTLIFFAVAYVALRRPPLAQVWRFVLGSAVAVGTALPLLAYPLWIQFKGPQSVPNGVFSPDYFIADLASFVAISPLSILGGEEAGRLSTGPSEYNTFLGWPLVLLLVALAVWLRRSPAALAAFLSAAAMAWLSLGPVVVINRERTGIAAPYELLKGVPVIDGALPLRFALAAIPLIAVMLVFAVDKARGKARKFVLAGVLIALIPVIPAPLPTADRAAVPAFYAEGDWRQCAAEGEVIVPVPLPTPPEPGPMRFATDQQVTFALPEGFFIGPYGRNGRATIGTWRRPTSALLAEVAKTGQRPGINDGHRVQARADLARWNAACVVLTEHRYRAALQATLEDLLGPGKTVKDATIWTRS